MLLCSPLRGRGISPVIPALITLICLIVPLRAHSDDYLDSLEAEADSTTVLQKAQKEHEKLKKLAVRKPVKDTPEPALAKTKKVTSTKAAKNSTPVKIDAKLKKEFEDGLYREFPGNYAVYTGLSEPDKQEVIAAFQQTSHIKGLVRYGPALTLILKIASQ